ncbi:MAG TPA: hypothetical protein VFZ41_00765 [Solirubrobacterales bacterium]
MRPHTVLSVVVVVAILGLVALGAWIWWPQEVEPGRVVAEEVEPEPVEKTVDGGEMTGATAEVPEFGPKVFVFDMGVGAGGSVTLGNPRLVYGGAPNAASLPEMFTVELLDAAGEVLAARPVFDPRWTFVWDDEEDRDEVALAEAAEAPVVVRFVPGAAVAAVRREGVVVAEVEVSGLVAAFCQKNAEDPDCRGVEGTEPN